MKDSPERALKEAREWLATAEMALADAKDDDALANVACAQAIHSLIRANDALTLKFLGVKGTRHDDLPLLLKRIIRERKVLPEDERFADLLSRAMESKSGADYGKTIYSVEDAERFIGLAREFLDRVEYYVSA